MQENAWSYHTHSACRPHDFAPSVWVVFDWDEPMTGDLPPTGFVHLDGVSTLDRAVADDPW